VAIAGIASLAFLLRWLHLFDADHYFIISPDSYYFHWLATRQLAGDHVSLQGSGLAYPLAYAARVLSVFGLSRSEALGAVCKILPPILSLAGMAILYFGVRKIYHPSLAVFSSLAWAIMPTAILIGAAGYLDRDCLSIVLIMAGALIFYVSKDWRLSVSGKEFGWLLAAVLVALIEGVLYMEWKWAGPAFLLAILVPYSVIELALVYVKPATDRPPASKGRPAERLRSSHWKTFGVVLALNALAIGVMHDRFIPYAHYIADGFGNVGESAIQEMTGLTPGDILVYGTLLIPIVYGVGIATARRKDGDIFFLSWMGFLLLLGLFAKRAFFVAIPPLCVFAGMGFERVFLWTAKGTYQGLKKAVFVLLILAFLVHPVLYSQRTAATRMSAPDADWQDALVFLRTTPPESRVVSWWDYGYWILDLGERTPLVDGGYYGYDDSRLQYIARTYCILTPSEARDKMLALNIQYLIFSTLDGDLEPTILDHANADLEGGAFPEESLFRLVMLEGFQSEGGLKVVHRSSPNGTVVVLGLSRT
jgi:asparagine N-glycosylation enzyme membrane subunit Stt3